MGRRSGWWGSRGCPADAGLRLCEDCYSAGIRREVARLSAHDAFAPSAVTLERLTGVHVAQRQIEELARRAAADVCDSYLHKPPEAVPEDALLVLSFDAAGIVMRTEALRPCTRKLAEREPHEPSFPPKLQSGRKPNGKRLAQVGAVYAIERYVRTADDILGELQSLSREAEDASEAPRPRRPRPINKRVFASVARPYSTVVDEGFRDALARDPKRERRWVVLVDKPGSDGAREWVVERVRALLNGADPSQVAAGMRRSATLPGRPGKIERRGAVDKCAKYMLGLAEYMRYGDALRAGLPIATGVIEGACRHLIRRRLGIGGARWSVEGAEAILLLRAAVLSGDFDDYWKFHEARVYAGTHASKSPGRVPRTGPALKVVKCWDSPPSQKSCTQARSHDFGNCCQGPWAARAS